MGGSVDVAGASGSSDTAGASGGADPAETCGSTQKSCAGQCVDIDDVTYGCSDTSCNQSVCPAAARTLACQAGKCVIDSCVAGQKKCDGKCVSVDDPGYGCSADGCDASACPAPGAGTLVCSGSACVIGSCGATKKKCDSKCVPLDANNGCADAGRCTSCAANEVCTGAPSACTCVADDAEACKGKACGNTVNNCGKTLTCKDTCVSPQTCGGANAGPNECGCTADNACLGKSCGSVTNVCGDSVSCTNTCKAPTPACTGNQCVECTVATDCPAIVCAKAACTANKCTYGTVAANTKCTAGTCSTTKAGICARPQVSVGTFKIDATEVTRGSYLQFVQAKNGDVSGQPAVCSTNTSYVPPMNWPPTLAQYELPAVYVDWCDAYAYCAWAGERLCGKIGGGTLANGEPYDDPTQDQWMKACSGTANTAFPYGSTFDDTKCNGAQPVAVATFPQCVGGYPGLYDMSGNSPEWEDACVNPNDFCRKRGSHYGDAPQNSYLLLRCDENGYQPRDTKDANLSFRCCSNP
jgi:hypothetical protein